MDLTDIEHEARATAHRIVACFKYVGTPSDPDAVTTNHSPACERAPREIADLRKRVSK